MSGTVEVGVLCELLDLVVEPLSSFRGTRLGALGAKGIGRGATAVESLTLGAIWQGLGASIGLTWRLEPEVGVDLRAGGISCWKVSNAGSTDVAPVCAVSPHVWDTVAACVDDEVRIPACSSELLRHELDVVMFGVASVPLAFELAWVFTACFTLVLAIQAIVIPVGTSAPWARLSEWLVVGDVSCESTEVVEGHSFHDLDELGHVVRPSEPSTVSGIKVHGGTGSLSCKCGDCILDTLLVCLL